MLKVMMILSLVFVNSVLAETKVGDLAPSLKVTNHLNQTVELSEQYKTGKVLFFFFPKAFTPGCTAQACSLRDSFKILKEKGVLIYGVSTDKVETLAQFHEKHSLPYELISDREKALSKAFGVGTTFGMLDREAILTDKGKVIWIDRDASTKEQAADVLKFIENAPRL